MEKPGEPRVRRSNRRRAEQTIQTLIAALLLGTASGCATFDNADRPPAPLFNARPSARPITVVLVQRGDTVGTVARRFGLTSQAIIDANGLSEPYSLARGQRLVLPPSTMYTVAEGDTVSSIARAYGVSRDAIIDANDLTSPNELVAGQRIAVPYAGPKPRTVARSAVVPVRTADLAPPPSIRVTKADGPDPRLEGARFYALGRPRPKPVLDGQGGPEEFDPPPPERTASIDLDAPYDPSAKVENTERSSEQEGLVRSSNRFIWPVRGKVISDFGRRGTGAHNDGINIAAEPGSPVKAAEGGVVVYAGNELAGYGNLLLVRHASGYVTAYAHNKRLLVGRGDNVRQGQTIALVGSTGDVDRPQLHFEIRKGDRAVDPNRYLTRATASR